MQVWDPLRKKMVALTPEEKVRQWFITLLRDTMKVPDSMMKSEVSFQFGSKEYRADILVFDRKASPLMVVECKRPDIRIDQRVVDQALRYHMALGVEYLALTNGNSSYIFHRTENGFEALSSIPEYLDMITRNGR